MIGASLDALIVCAILVVAILAFVRQIVVTAIVNRNSLSRQGGRGVSAVRLKLRPLSRFFFLTFL